MASSLSEPSNPANFQPSNSSADPAAGLPDSSAPGSSPSLSTLPSLSSASSSGHSITIEDIRAARRCGVGGFSSILAVEHPTLGHIALKCITRSTTQSESDLKQRAMREGEKWRGLNHANILPFIGVFEVQADLYLVSPFIENGSLDSYLRNNLNAERPRLLCEIAAAIAYLHDRGIVHGDIKASNILISNDVHPLLCDFGLTKFEDTMTSLGMEGMGTTRYQSPELLLGTGRKTSASDVWAFGMTIYEVLSDKIPFHESNNVVMVVLIVTQDARPPMWPTHSPSGISYSRLWSAAKDCWLRAPKLRPTMGEIHRGLSSHSPEKIAHFGLPKGIPNFQSLLYGVMQAGRIRYTQEKITSGLQHERVWGCCITVTHVFDPSLNKDIVGQTSIGSAGTMEAAREQAALNTAIGLGLHLETDS